MSNTDHHDANGKNPRKRFDAIVEEHSKVRRGEITRPTYVRNLALEFGEQSSEDKHDVFKKAFPIDNSDMSTEKPLPLQSHKMKSVLVDLNKGNLQDQLDSINLRLKKSSSLFNGIIHNFVENVQFATNVVQGYKRIESKFNKIDHFLCITSMELSEALTSLQKRCCAGLSGIHDGTVYYDYSNDCNFIKFDTKCLVFDKNVTTKAANYDWEGRFYARFLISANGIYLYKKDGGDYVKILLKVIQTRICGEITEEIEDEQAYSTCLL